MTLKDLEDTLKQLEAEGLEFEEHRKERAEQRKYLEASKGIGPEDLRVSLLERVIKMGVRCDELDQRRKGLIVKTQDLITRLKA